LSIISTAIKFITPEQRHAGKDEEILNCRKAVYQQAKLAPLVFDKLLEPVMGFVQGQQKKLTQHHNEKLDYTTKRVNLK
jgi:hypothetical protein